MARMRRTGKLEKGADQLDAWREHWSKPIRTTSGTSIELFGNKSEKDAQTSLRLPQAMYDALAKAAAAHDQRIGEEIRQRVEVTFLLDIKTEDDKTQKLLDAISIVARDAMPTFGPWHRNRFGFDVFRAAVLTLIDLHRPAGGAVRPSGNEAADFFLGEDATAETAGKMLASAAAVSAGIPLPGQTRR